jgi:hypothetical protein
MPESKRNVSAGREAELASAMQFLNFALGAAEAMIPPNLITVGRASEPPSSE